VPQYSQNWELTAGILEGSLQFTLNYSRTDRPIGNVYVFDPERPVTLYTTRNLELNQTGGLSVGFYLPLAKWYTLTGFAYGFFNRFEGDLGFGQMQIRQWAGIVNTTQVFTLPKDITIELSGEYMSTQAYYLMRYRPVWQIGLAAQKKLWGERAVVRVGVTDMFWIYVWRGQGNLGDIRIQDDFRWDNRVVTLGFTYYFGNRFRLEGGKDKPEIKSAGGGRAR
jgi:hypothetical protein